MKKLLAAFLVCSSLAMAAAFGSGTVWRVRPGGSDTNGGVGFDPGVASPGTDESNTDAGTAITVTLTGTGTTGTASPAFTTTTHGPGNFIRITGGSGCTTSPGVYELLSQASGTGTFNISMGSSTDVCTGFIGGAAASPGYVAGLDVLGNTVCVYNAGSTIYTISVATSNVANGYVTQSSPGAYWIGYTSNCAPGTTDAKPEIQAGASVGALTMLTAGGSFPAVFENIIIDGNKANNSNAIIAYSGGEFIDDTIQNFSHATASSALMLIHCTITGNSAIAAYAVVAVWNESYGNTANGIEVTYYAGHNLSYNNTGATTDGIQGVNSPLLEANSVYGNGRYGIRMNGGIAVFMNNYADQNVSANYEDLPPSSLAISFNNASWCTTGCAAATSGSFLGGAYNFQTLSGSAFTNTGSTIFTLNNTASAGATLRNAAWPATFPAGLTASYLDIGAAMHQALTAPNFSARLYRQGKLLEMVDQWHKERAAALGR